ncbi:hypothetical protein [Haloarcula sediminis]|uniref:hypothetical protein n=1 Tax=Haloarcula sediminis TaxID=3111777 RepID=UPI002D7779A0|nr:hypothetical protein [Haloarcula sp. CK38]
MNDETQGGLGAMLALAREWWRRAGPTYVLLVGVALGISVPFVVGGVVAVGVGPTHTSTETAFAALVAGLVAAVYTVGVLYLLAPVVLQRLYGTDGGAR